MLAAPLTSHAHASNAPAIESPGLAYLEARAAQLEGDHGRSANLLAALAERSGDVELTKRALATALTAGDVPLALQLTRSMPQEALPINARMLLVAEELRQRNAARAIAASGEGAEGGPAFLVPLIRAWDAAERRNLAGALAALDSAPANGIIAPFRDEHRALILLKFNRSAEAAPLAARALGAAGGRRGRMRIVFADAFLRAGDQQRALAVISQSDDPSAIARIRSGKPIGQTIETAAGAFSELVTALALDLSRGDKDLPIGLLHIARHADPSNSGAALLQGLLLDLTDRKDAALAVLSQVKEGDALSPQARDFEVRVLASGDQLERALAIARPLALRPSASAADWERFAEVLHEMGRHDQAAEAFARAIALVRAQGSSGKLWQLHLSRAATLEEADRWPEAKNDLHAALAIAPDEPQVLNFLGYSKLERGEELDLAEAMIRKASRLAPDEPSITDSLGWALYKRGRLPEAIETLQRAAANDAQQAEIHEHLGDALYAAGRRFEARFSWNAALLTADDEIAERVRAKLSAGLTPETAAP